jgi:hypothetical protein
MRGRFRTTRGTASREGYGLFAGQGFKNGHKPYLDDKTLEL